ncbi:MAG: helix-turn-helix transcriptional regulator [Deltaproteobacteria bacterium]|nr:helix-turn-helix transcriptional regulator [Deltaproteobacteria bacterium]MBI2531102.1 helix-turn-helix transcriptional regulator [Deltaproteobacteria bacterium]MBI3064278.1 helix-turn-helix transcriptional regulator [Deltaproteobacteria bacterium]
MHRIKIKISMLQRGIYTQKALAQKLGVNPSTITRLLKGQRRSKRLEKEIAEILELPPRGGRPREK